MAQVRTYSPDQVHVIVGPSRLSGFTDGTFITVSMDGQAYQKRVGADGQVSRARTGDLAGTVQVTLLSTSASNDILSAFAIADETSDEGVFPLLIKDSYGTTLIQTSSAWIQQKPDREFSNEVTEVQWTIDCVQLRSFIGQNNPQAGGGDS